MAGKTDSTSDLRGVRHQLEQLASEGRHDELIELVVELLTAVRQDNTRLRVRLQNALRALYGRKSEKVSSDQLALLFAELGDEVPQGARDVVAAATDEQDESGEVEQPKQRPRSATGAKGRRPLPEDLPREERVIRVPDELRVCPKCGEEKSCIGHIRSELLEFVPAQFKVIVQQREKLACKRCGDGVVAAPSTKPMDRGRPGPGLLAHLVVSKGQDSLPLYRQSQIYQRSGVTIAPSTLGEWHGFACDVLEPIARAIVGRVLSSLVIRADDTGLKVLDPKHPKGVKLGHLWGYVGDDDLVAFDYTPTWEAKGPQAFLHGFDGYLQGDGYAGFKALLERERGSPIVGEKRRLGCGMHVRRKFEQAKDAGDARGAIALAWFRRLYEVEREAKKTERTAIERQALREEQSLPVLDELYAWIHETHEEELPDSPLGKATRYAINQEAFFRRCFTDGRFEIDNGEVERQLRRVALGRKNYLFAGSDKGAERLAVGYTILGSCHMRGIDPLAYATDVIDKVQNGWPKSRLGELLPDVWRAPGREARQEPVVEAATTATAPS